ncbi:enoyl-CoA hydratase-related protein [Egicoccus sp. AB-alg2]|uniref:enoyl-CoA hydratase-related protein n=1 Tax=Egicoccus sp. AB-alg2 TaxID=3242693 RepID=UPI00359E655F
MNDDTGPTDEVRLEREGHLARVTIDRPKVLNAVDQKTLRRLQDIWDELETDDDVRLVILTGAGERSFCVGADMSAEDGDGPDGLRYWAEERAGGFGGLSLRDTLDVPVIARVNGYALGGGFEMMLGADLVVAADHAQFALPEPRVGRLPADGGMPLLPRRIPRVFAMEMLLTGRRISAEEALRFGLVNRVVPMSDLDDAVDELAQQVLACAPLSVKAIKQLVQRTGHLTPQEAQGIRLPTVLAAFDSEDGQEGPRAFREKRVPVWKGR